MGGVSGSSKSRAQSLKVLQRGGQPLPMQKLCRCRRRDVPSGAETAFLQAMEGLPGALLVSPSTWGERVLGQWVVCASAHKAASLLGVFCPWFPSWQHCLLGLPVLPRLFASSRSRQMFRPLQPPMLLLPAGHCGEDTLCPPYRLQWAARDLPELPSSWELQLRPGWLTQEAKPLLCPALPRNFWLRAGLGKPESYLNIAEAPSPSILQDEQSQLLQHESRHAPACSDTTLCMSPLPLPPPVCTGGPLLWLILPDWGPSEKCHQCSCNLWWDCVKMPLSCQQCWREPAMPTLASYWWAFTPTGPSSHWCCPCLLVRNCQLRETFWVLKSCWSMPHPGLPPTECATGPERGKDASQGLSSFGSRGQRSSLMTKEREKLPHLQNGGRRTIWGTKEWR